MNSVEGLIFTILVSCQLEGCLVWTLAMRDGYPF